MAEFTAADSADEALQHLHIALLVARLIHWGFGDEGTISKARIVEKPPERLDADIPLPDVVMSVELRTARGFGEALPAMSVK